MVKVINIVHYKAGDYGLLIDLWERSGLPYKPKGRDSLESIEKEVGLDSNQFLFAILNGKAVGSILVTHDGRKGWINRVAVVPELGKEVLRKNLSMQQKNGSTQKASVFMPARLKLITMNHLKFSGKWDTSLLKEFII